MSDQKLESAAPTTAANGDTALLAISPVIERQLADQIRNLRDGLEAQVGLYPDAQLELRKLVGTWINEAERALTTYQETGVTAPIDIAAMTARVKRRYKAELIVVRQAYPKLKVKKEHKRMCARIDGFYPAYLQQLVNERIDDDNRINKEQFAHIVANQL